MYPKPETAERELTIAGMLNPGPWTLHSKNVGLAAKRIAEKSGGINSEKEYVFGLLHMPWRRIGMRSPEYV